MLFVVLAAGCSALRPQPGDAERVDRVLAETLQLQHASPARQRNALTRARQAFAEGGGRDIDRLRLGTLFATLPAPLGEETRAIDLLRPLASQRPETALTRFAAILVSQVAERRRLEQVGQRGEQALRHSEHQASELRHKLDELKSIERSVLQREEQLHVE
ncbi:MAG: hypothetical protein M0015_17155 [Betaproteobacteria bacterium]|nr:hypothetical protein [Betaproteobacteria bacterium]